VEAGHRASRGARERKTPLRNVEAALTGRHLRARIVLVAMDSDGEDRDCVGDTGTRRRDKRVGGWGDQGGEEGREGRVMRGDGPSGVARRTREDDAPT